MPPFDFVTPLLAVHLARAHKARATAAAQAPRQQALAALRASPLHQVMSAPLAHPTALAMPHLVMPPVSKPIASGSGIKHPTTQELALKVTAATPTAVKVPAQAQVDALKQLLANMVAAGVVYMHAHPPPAASAQPDVIAAYLKASGLSPRTVYPQWAWHVVQKANLSPALFDPLATAAGGPLEVGEAVAVVQLGPSDGVVWVQHTSGAWSYTHHWGQDFGQMLSSVAASVIKAVSQGVSDVQHVVASVSKVVSTVLDYAKIAASVVPGLGQVVNEVVSVAEAALDALGGESALAIALDTVFHAILASAPGLPALGPFVQPVVDVLKQILSGSSLTAAAVHTAIGDALAQVPDQPSVAGFSPRSLGASLAGWVVSKLGLG